MAVEAWTAVAPSPDAMRRRSPLATLVATAPKRRGHFSMGRSRKMRSRGARWAELSMSPCQLPEGLPMSTRFSRRAIASISEAVIPLAQSAPTRAPTLVPVTTVTGSLRASISCSTPRCA